MLYTAGHSNAELADFISLMREHDIELVVDVRSKPRSRLAHFDLAPLQDALEEAGIQYEHYGDRLGGVPHDPDVRARWRQGHLDPVIIAALRASDEWLDGLQQLASRLSRLDGPACIMCSEADPNECHRSAVALDVAELLPGFQLEHLSIRKTAPREVGVQEVLL
jgi:uncharacterized protein (DUF488 family)